MTHYVSDFSADMATVCNYAAQAADFDVQNPRAWAGLIGTLIAACVALKWAFLSMCKACTVAKKGASVAVGFVSKKLKTEPSEVLAAALDTLDLPGARYVENEIVKEPGQPIWTRNVLYAAGLAIEVDAAGYPINAMYRGAEGEANLVPSLTDPEKRAFGKAVHQTVSRLVKEEIAARRALAAETLRGAVVSQQKPSTTAFKLRWNEGNSKPFISEGV